MIKHENQWTLGLLIDALEKARPKYIFHAYAGLYLDGLRSYRGYYEDLAIGASKDRKEECDDCEAFLQHLKDSVGTIFEGYKGGYYVVSSRTPLWIANYGECGDTIVTGLHVDGDYAHILGEWIGGAK